MAGPIRQPIDLESFDRYLRDHVPEIKTPVEVKQFGYGQSNPTYLLTSTIDNARYVMRKKPPGKLLSRTAHQVDREYRIIAAMSSKTDVPVPRAICLCEDDSVIGTAFYIMSFLQGRIFEDPSLPGVSADERREMWHSIATTLGKYHRVVPAEVGMADFGRSGNFYNRQLKTFARLSVDQAKTRDKDTGREVGKIPHYDEMVRFFGEEASQPRDRSTFVHGDYKVDNVVFHATEPRVIGILDWEMATIGHPLSDLCNLIGPYTTASSRTAREASSTNPGLASRVNPAFLPDANTPGLPSKQQICEWYSSASGFTFTPQELRWGEAFGTYRGSVIMQGIAARYAQRQASSEKAREYGDAMAPMAEVGWGFIKEVQESIARDGVQAGGDGNVKEDRAKAMF